MKHFPKSCINLWCIIAAFFDLCFFQRFYCSLRFIRCFPLNFYHKRFPSISSNFSLAS